METTEITCPTCSGPVKQTGSGRPRRFCSPGCRETYWNRRESNGARSEDHEMTEVDPIARTGTCSQCGPNSRVYRGGTRGTGRWRCRNRVRAQPSVVVGQPKMAELAPDKRVVARVRKMRARGIDITAEEWAALKVEAAGRCQLCGREAELHTDHDHGTRKVRGLLCSTCNTGLGKLGDSTEMLRRAIAYLQRNATAAVRP